MAKKDKLEPPKSSPEDTAHLVTSGILSWIPGAPELFRKFVTPPLEKRQYEWMEEVANTLRQLEKKSNFSIDDLSKNEPFASVVIQATSVAIRNHHEEKRRALANCIFNAGISVNLDADLQLAFVRFVDELSPSHIQLLQIIRNRQNEIVSMKSYNELYELLRDKLSESLTTDVFKMICLELQARGLIRISPDMEDFSGIYEADHLTTRNPTKEAEGLPRIAISEVGRRFLSFISINDNAV
jgi:hypothetical protein